jgi:hypothetical protein
VEWVPESYPRAGGLAAAGFYKLLGRPRLDPLTVLVRETAQNSWDARLDNVNPVAFTVQGWHHTDDERHSLRSEVFVDAKKAVGTHLDRELASPELIGLYITDRNTKGLSGPLQADEADPDNTYDWVDFVLNVGKANTQGHTGGTYGFGKTISYVVSAANAVVIHSRTRYKGRDQTRLIACAIGEEFTRAKRLYTGRHWWGEREQDVPGPVTGQAADRLAARIGMPEFNPGETGTNILIIAPDLGGRTPEQAMRFIAESVTWHLWPKLIERSGKRAMDIDVSWNGETVAIPRPEDRPPLQGFAQAFQAVLDGRAGDKSPLGMRFDSIRCQRPATAVGTLATVPLVYRERAVVDDGSNPDDSEAPAPAAVIVGVSHHVALLRTPELVIEYLEGPPPTEGGTEWAGVFRARDEHDGYFAAAEPPTHDSWNPSLLPKSQGRTIVNVGLREIRKVLENRWAQRKRASHEDASSTAVIADELAHLIRSVEAKGPGRHRREKNPINPGPAKPKVDIVYCAPVELQGELGTLARVRISPAPSSIGTRLHVQVAAALDGKDADPKLDPSLSLVEARIGDVLRDVSGLSEVLTVDHAAPIEIDLVVRRGADTTVLFDLDAERA